MEVKAATRASRTLEVFMQESAQMAAWILEHPNEPPNPVGRRFQVLQDKDAIYLNFARYGSKYLSYSRGEGHLTKLTRRLSQRSLKLGLSEQDTLGHMKKLVPILVALTLRAVEDEKEELLAAKEKKK